MLTTPSKPFRLRSFVRRDSRMTKAQAEAQSELWAHFGIAAADNVINYADIFQREANTVLEIGFGSGMSLLAAAKANPELNFIGIETHKPGIGSLLLGIKREQLTNLRIFYGDAVDIVENNIPTQSLYSIQVFFPDPWQKRRHHPRRLIQTEFVQLLAAKLMPNGTLHLATDWEEYALHMMAVVSNEKSLTNLAGVGNFAGRSPYRPILSKFEQRAMSEQRKIFELQFMRGYT